MAMASKAHAFSEDKLDQHACGIFACVLSENVPPEDQSDVAKTIYLGLVGLQHRGQESAGIVTSGVNKFHSYKGMGLVSNVFQESNLATLKGNMGIGHTRYSTAGSSELINCQPFVVDTIHRHIAVAHNGELTNAKSVRDELLKQGVGLSTSSDSEVITQLLTARPPCGEPEGADWVARIKYLASKTQCSYSLVIMTQNSVYAVRDPYGNRPLCVGRIDKSRDLPENQELSGNGWANSNVFSWVISSESCSFPSIGAVLEFEVDPGEIIQVTSKGPKSLGFIPPTKVDDIPAFCIFEYVYFARADSVFEGQMVYTVRQRSGVQLAIEAPVEAEVVSTVPESATPSAMGYSQQTGIPYVEVLTKNRYVGRTFIQPSTRLRQLGVSKKFGPLTENFAGKRVVLIDDSIVRGNTIAPIIKLLKKAGAKEVHIRIASPPLKYPCYMGVNIPTKDELIANKHNAEELALQVGADSLQYLSVEGLKKAIQSGIQLQKERKIGHCTACLTGDYPVELEW
ncbi:amidophosphoribosyltransferase [Exaiptasia diaphana]|uniref:Amidophosphoribosyltransferase n=1 Tax=Exaiptasia diaphana TaxID=2652724 RepID=A0A913XJC0_EXADI|nr:amidophosphoribosyltransferase [Exaiptasia diaphana]KXJ25881.1 Amidophosphoribosyltransferase [Exaiptasia diaphana]